MLKVDAIFLQSALCSDEFVRGLFATDDDDDDVSVSQQSSASTASESDCAEPERSYLFYAAIRDIDTTAHDRRVEEKRLQLARDARRWTVLDATRFQTDRFAMLERPLIDRVCRLLEQWRDSGAVPASLRLDPLPLLTCVVDGAALLAAKSAEVVRLLRDETRWKHVFAVLGVDGVMSLLSLRITAGTARGHVPPGLRRCWRAFNEPHAAGARLTVGARALTKHWGRSSERFWGESIDGPDGDKNVNACRVLCSIIDDLSWLNVHALPHDTFVFEIRNSASYGARWHVGGDGATAFRGFLEPQAVDGHATGWQH